MKKPYKKYEDELDFLREQSLFREIPKIEEKEGKYIFSEGKRYLNLSSNDYLAIASNKKFINEFLEEHRHNSDICLGSSSSRLLTGECKAYNELENYLANAYKKESCVLFNSGYHANLGVVSALCQKGCAVFSDKLNHASIIDGMKLANGDFFRYRHLDYANLEALLEKHAQKYEQLIIISESVFSMDGDIADIQKLCEIKKKFNAILIIDEAHSLGIFGEKGLGLSEQKPDVDIVLSPFGKAIGSYGAFATGDKVLIDYIKNKARSFIFSTTIPPISALWTKWILEKKLPMLQENRIKLLELSQKLREALQKENIESLGNSQIVPIIIGEDKKTVQLSQTLRSKGFWALPIRPPTVKKGQSRLRLSLNSDMLWDDIEAITHIIKEGL